jgi:hypothetical protein
MGHERRDNSNSTTAWKDREASSSRTQTLTEVPYENTPEAVLWEVSVILASTLGVALIVNIAFAIFHIA